MKAIEYFSLIIKASKSGNYGTRDHVPSPYDINAENAQKRLSKVHLPKIEPVFSDLVLDKESAEVDFINNNGAIGGFGIILSQKAKEVFEKHNLGLHRFYSLILRRNEATRIKDAYYWLQMIPPNFEEFIQFSESTFFRKETFLNSQHSLEISSFSDYKQALANIDITSEKVIFSKLELTQHFKNEKQDLIRLPKLDFHPIVSSALMNDILDSKLTGINQFRSLPIS